MAAALPLNAHSTGENSTVPISVVATPTAIAIHGPARIAAMVIPIESRKIGSLTAATIQPMTRFRPTSVGIRTSLVDDKGDRGLWMMGCGDGPICSRFLHAASTIHNPRPNLDDQQRFGHCSLGRRLPRHGDRAP